MITKTAIKKIIGLQQKHIAEVNTGVVRKAVSELPYITDVPLLVGGMRGAGRTTLLAQVIRSDYPDAWYADFEDPRLAGFDAGDARKLDELISESGKGVLVFDNVDCMDGWEDYITRKSERDGKVIASVALDVLCDILQSRRTFAEQERNGKNGKNGRYGKDTGIDTRDRGIYNFQTYRLEPLSYPEFLEFSHKSETGGPGMVADYIAKGSFPDYIRSRRHENLLQLYNEILAHDIIIRKGIRDTAALSRLALYLVSNTGGLVSANGARDKLGVKAVSSVADNMGHLERAGLVGFLPLYDENPSVRAVNPRMVYTADTALAQTLAPGLADRPEKLFGIIVFRHICKGDVQIFYTAKDGGCDFVVTEEGRPAKLVQACYDAGYEQLQQKIAGLKAAMRQTGLERGTVVTLDENDALECGEGLIEIVDADTFLGGDKIFY